MQAIRILAAMFVLISLPALAAEQTVTIHKVTPDGVAEAIGTVTLSDSAQGLVITPDLTRLPAGEHGFHIHENPSCAAVHKNSRIYAALSAGGHYDPSASGKHAGPIGDGHAGDLPVLVADANGNAKTAVVAPRLQLVDVIDRAIIIHAGGDNYSDSPEPLGGGGSRIACGVIE